MTGAGGTGHAGAMTTRTAPRRRPYLWTLGVLWLLPALLVGLGWLVLPEDPPPGQCEGIGFGCTLSPADSVLLLGVLAAPALVTAGVAGVAVIAVVQAVRARRRARPDRRGTGVPRVTGWSADSGCA
jgi:hypothetical protein